MSTMLKTEREFYTRLKCASMSDPVVDVLKREETETVRIIVVSHVHKLTEDLFALNIFKETYSKDYDDENLPENGATITQFVPWELYTLAETSDLMARYKSK